jgi:uncharacterized membrane protein YhaH (DUF805 family)
VRLASIASIALPMSATTQPLDSVAASAREVADVVLSITALLASLFLVALLLLALALTLWRWRSAGEPLPWRRLGSAGSPQSGDTAIAAASDLRNRS